MATSSTVSLPSIRWGIIATGWISEQFVKDIVRERKDAPVRHLVTAVGSSSPGKGAKFVQDYIPGVAGSIDVYDSYAPVYTNQNVDIVYIGTPHAFHKQNCLDAINAGKHVLCEKPIAINEREAKEIIDAAKSKGVFFMEAVWTRFFPITRELYKILHTDKIIGKVHRLFCDLSLDMNFDNLPMTSRLKNPALGAGALLDIGIYSLLWGTLLLDPELGDKAAKPQIYGSLQVTDGVDHNDAIILSYPEQQAQAILTCTMHYKSDDDFCIVEGSEGRVVVSSKVAASCPQTFRVEFKDKRETIEKDFTPEGLGMYFEANAVALDILAHRKESELMPHAESLRMMRIMDGIRKDNGVVYPQDIE